MGKTLKKALTKNQIKALSEYLTILSGKYRDKVVDVLVFGPVARGDYDEKSDIDILVVVKNGEAKLQDEISMASYEPMLKNDVVISSFVMDEIMYNWQRKYKDPRARSSKEKVFIGGRGCASDKVWIVQWRVRSAKIGITLRRLGMNLGTGRKTAIPRYGNV